MFIVNAGKNISLNANDISYFCPTVAAPPELLARAIDLSGGSRRTFVTLNNKVGLLIDITAQTLLTRLNSAAPATGG